MGLLQTALLGPVGWGGSREEGWINPYSLRTSRPAPTMFCGPRRVGRWGVEGSSWALGSYKPATGISEAEKNICLGRENGK